MDATKQGEGWLHPCDLCGSLEYQQVESPQDDLYRCHVCGLVSRPEDERSRDGEDALDPQLFDAIVRRLVRKLNGDQEFSVLVVGPIPERTAQVFARGSLSLTHYTGSLASAGYAPNTFDVVLISRAAESFNSLASLFARTRTWLRPLGLFVIGGANWESMERRLWSDRWLRLHAGHHLYPGGTHLRPYATRYGFEIVTRGTTVRLGSIARTAFGSTSTLGRIAASPLGIIGSAPGLGSAWWGILVKRGLATRPVLEKTLEEKSAAPGLAGAGYTAIKKHITSN